MDTVPIVTSDPLPSYVMYVDSYDQSGNTKIFSLYVFGLQQDDFGTYVCVAENSLGTARAELHLYGTFQSSVRTSYIVSLSIAMICILLYFCEQRRTIAQNVVY